MIFGAFRYLSPNDDAPSGYVCGTCGSGGGAVKLWRDYNTFLDHQTLTCAQCLAPELKVDDKGKIPYSYEGHSLGMIDQIKGRVPAIPTEDGGTMWGYTSVPENGVAWWHNLPTYPRRG